MHIGRTVTCVLKQSPDISSSLECTIQYNNQVKNIATIAEQHLRESDVYLTLYVYFLGKTNIADDLTAYMPPSWN